MNILYYDSGTTNTRAYLFENGILTQQMFLAVGSKDSALAKSNVKMLEMMRDAMQELAHRAGLTVEQIEEIWMSGMVSSPTGIVEIPHLKAPVNPKMVAEQVVRYRENTVFQRELHIIPGVKTLPPEGNITLENFTQINMMRGEETEIFGLMECFPQLKENSILLMPGSHTQIAFIQKGCIVNILSTITGELYKAITQNTILSTSLAMDTAFTLKREYLHKGYEALRKYGFNRALYTVRTMELFLQTTADERHSYFEGILNGSIIDLAVQAATEAGGTLPTVVLYGTPNAISVLSSLFAQYFPEYTCKDIPNDEMAYATQGFLCLRMQKNGA